jgi:hypothetical protein
MTNKNQIAGQAAHSQVDHTVYNANASYLDTEVQIVNEPLANPQIAYRASIGQLLQLRQTLAASYEATYEATYDITTALYGSVKPSLSQLTTANSDLSEALNILILVVFNPTAPLSKSHADRLVKALCSLIDSRLPK